MRMPLRPLYRDALGDEVLSREPNERPEVHGVTL